MRNNILKLRTGQKISVLLLNPDVLFEEYNLYYDKHLNKYFISNKININIFKIDYITRIVRNHALVEYNGELKIIHFGRKILEKLKELSIDLNLKSSDFLQHYITLHVNIKNTLGFPNFDDCYLTIHHTDPIDNYFETAEYLKIINSYNKYINDAKLENNPFLIEYLHTMKLIDDKCPLIRLLKFKKLMK